jgi:uncharacterized protein (DUF433 family)
MIERIVPQFGQGFYTAADAANILDIPYNKVGYWFRKYVKGEFEVHSNYRYYYESEKVTAVNFHTLIEVYVFDFFRQNKISTNKIVVAHQELSKLLNTPYPFCHTDFLLSSGKDILYKIQNTFVEATPGFQQAIFEYVGPYSKKIEFINSMASKYFPLGKDHSIVVNPNNQFGCPIITGTNIRVNTLVSLYRGGEEIEFIADLFDLKPNQVLDAITFAKAA